MCDNCKSLMEYIKCGNTFIKCTVYKDDIFMQECFKCHSISVWKALNYNSHYVIKFISKSNPEYIIWKLK